MLLRGIRLAAAKLMVGLKAGNSVVMSLRAARGIFVPKNR